jgi:hypothetical protein
MISDYAREDLFMRIGLTALLLGMLAPAAAHHSAAQFDFAQTVTVEGTVMFVDVRNPHTVLILEVTDAEGAVREIEYEGHSRNNYYRNGWRPGMIEVGDTVAIDTAPMRDGTDGGYVKEFVLGDGTRF